MEYHIHQLNNGIRLVHQQSNSPVSHCGLMVQAGSRNETPKEHGMAHLIEHMLFKGTSKRKAFHILSRMEDVGGELNAYTTKEETAILTTFYNNYYDRALELIQDIAFNSVFPLKEIVKEKEVIVDEINSYKDSPIEQIFDDFDEMVFADKALGRSILGTPQSLKAITQKDIVRFIQKNYNTDQMVVSSVGNLPFSKVKTLFEKYFSHIPPKFSGISNEPQISALETTASKRIEQKDTFQAHCVMGTLGYNHSDDKRIVLHLINNLLGGPGLNSRLNLTLREKKGYAYNIESNYTAYADTGVLTIYFGTDKKDIEKSVQLALKELKKLREETLGTAQLAKTKRQLLGQIAISSENFENLMLANAKSIIIYNKIDSLEQIKNKINSITANEILEVANEILSEKRISTLIYY